MSIVSLLQLLVDSTQKLVLGVLAHVEFVSKLFNDFLWDLALENSQKLNVLTAVKLNLENANWLLLLLHWRQGGSWLGFDLWVLAWLLLRRVVSWLRCGLVVGASISGLSRLWVRVLLLSHGIARSALRSWIRCLLLRVSSLAEGVLVLLLLLESGWWLAVGVWNIGGLNWWALNHWSLGERLALVHWVSLSHW